MAWPVAGTAQDPAAAEAEAMPVELVADARLPGGKAAFLRGEADAVGHKLAFTGMEISDLVEVSVFSLDPARPVRVRIAKDGWQAPDRDAVTDAGGRADFHFRTFEEFGVWVTADTPAPYEILVWQHPRDAGALPSMAVPASRFSGSSASLSPQVADAARAASAAGAAGAADAATLTTPAAGAAATAAPGGISLSWLELGLIAAVLLMAMGFAALLLRRRTPA